VDLEWSLVAWWLFHLVWISVISEVCRWSRWELCSSGFIMGWVVVISYISGQPIGHIFRGQEISVRNY